MARRRRCRESANTLDVGQIVEGLAFSDDGNYVALTAQDGSNHPFYNDNGLLVVFSVNGVNLTKVADAKIGKWNQGVVWSRGGKTLLAQNMVENSLSVVGFDGKSLRVTGEIKVKGRTEWSAYRGTLRRGAELRRRLDRSGHAESVETEGDLAKLTPMYGPAVRCKRTFIELADVRPCINVSRPLIGAFCANHRPGPR
jgi:hypothetical protein